MIVIKFGGTSVGNGERIRSVAQIAARTAERSGCPPVVVVSAMGGVTDTLIRAARTAASGDRNTFRTIRDELQQRHEQAIDDCGISRDYAVELRVQVDALLAWFSNLCQSIATLGELTPRGLDVVQSLGERFSARIVAATLLSQGIKAQSIEATELIVTTDKFGDAAPLFDETTEKVRTRLLPLIEAGVIPVVTGFIGATRSGLPTTLGRGGSDWTATILGRCLPADEVWIWTDVNGVMTADPRIVPEARTLEEISYAEVAELSHFGAKVLHPKTIQPVAQIGIPVRVLNAQQPEHPGTLVHANANGSSIIRGITAIRELTMVSVEGSGMLGVPGIAGRVFSAVASSGASILMITQSSSEQSICFVVRTADTPLVVEAVEGALELELLRGDIDRVKRHDAIAIIAVVGAGMRGKPGIASRVFGALADRGINILSIAQGSSEYNISLVVEQGDADEAVRSIHHQFGLDKE